MNLDSTHWLLLRAGAVALGLFCLLLACGVL